MKIYKLRTLGSDDNYRSLYRFSRESTESMASYFLPENNETRGGALSNVTKMKTFLRYIGDPGFQVGMGEDLGIHQATVCRTVFETCSHILAKSKDWIKFPQSEEELNIAKNEWANKYKFPSAIGALDCTHVLILKPKQHGDEYVNRKGLTSFNIQVTCNAKEHITSIDCRWAGSVHDSRIWRNSFVRDVINENPAGAILLGDEGYGISPWLMTPYRNANTTTQEKYNKLHSKERVVIERVFGQVKRRFPILQSKMRMQSNRILSMIGACFILHNISKYLHEPDIDEYTCTLDNGSNIMVPHNEEIDDNLNRRGVLRRNEISNYINQLSLN